MRIATWNVNSLAVRLPQVLDWLGQHPVDVLGLQELKLTDEKFPHAALQEAGYQAVSFGQKTYNGVALLCKSPPLEVVRNIPQFPDSQSRVIAATVEAPLGPVRVINAYFVNGQAPGTEKFAYKMSWLDALRQYVHEALTRHAHVVLMGDFNITFDDADSWDPEGLRETIHHTLEERAQLQALLDLGLVDAHRHCHPAVAVEKKDKHFSWWDYRDFAFRRHRGLRIDYVLVSQKLQPHIVSCHIDKAPRQNERPSDHVPVVLELQ